MRAVYAGVGIELLIWGWSTLAAAADLSLSELPLLVDESFQTADRWQPAAADGWKLIDVDGGKGFSQFKNVRVPTPHRSPWNIALLKDVTVADFVMEVKVKSTAKEYGHRDVCLVFGYQSPAKFYYVHFASKADKNANQIFIVNETDRRKITEKESSGVAWTDGWHTLKIVRKVSDGLIEAYFDDMTKPIMSAHDQTLSGGQIGIGTFDDTADFAQVKLWGNEPDQIKISLPPRITPVDN